MDYDKLIENFKQLEFVAYNYNINGEVLGMGCAEFESVMADAVLAIETLRAELARVTAERDGAVEEVKRLKAVMRDEGIVVIPPKYPWERAEWNV